MNFNNIRIKDIAGELNLSISTVSRALTDSHEIAPKTREKVKNYAEMHNYQPNPMAQSLKQGLSKSIGIVVANIENQFFSEVINGIESVAYQAGFNVIITQTNESSDRELKNLEHLVHRAIDGLLISLSNETTEIEYLKSLQSKGLPIVFFDRVSEDMATHKVIANNFKSGYDVTHHLLQSGYSRIAHITGSSHLSITKERLGGYILALQEAGIELPEEYIKYCPDGGSRIEIEHAMAELFTLKNKPDAIFTTTDKITTNTIFSLHQRKIKIPEEIALIGYTNTKLVEVLNPSLSSVYQPGFEMGQKAAEKLINLILTKRRVTDYDTAVLPTQLFIRASTAPKANQ